MREGGRQSSNSLSSLGGRVSPPQVLRGLPAQPSFEYKAATRAARRKRLRRRRRCRSTDCRCLTKIPWEDSRLFRGDARVLSRECDRAVAPCDLKSSRTARNNTSRPKDTSELGQLTRNSHVYSRYAFALRARLQFLTDFVPACAGRKAARRRRRSGTGNYDYVAGRVRCGFGAGCGRRPSRRVYRVPSLASLARSVSPSND